MNIILFSKNLFYKSSPFLFEGFLRGFSSLVFSINDKVLVFKVYRDFVRFAFYKDKEFSLRLILEREDAFYNNDFERRSIINKTLKFYASKVFNNNLFEIERLSR